MNSQNADIAPWERRHMQKKIKSSYTNHTPGAVHELRDDGITLCGQKPHDEWYRTSAGVDCGKCLILLRQAEERRAKMA